MIVARATIEEIFKLFTKNLKRRIATVKQYQGTSSSERDPQGVTSAQPPAPPPQKEAPNRRGEGQKKVKTSKPGK